MSPDTGFRVRQVTRLSLGFSLLAVCVSIGSFVAVQLQSNPAPWEPSALSRVGYVLVVLAVALALVVEPQAFVGAWQAQVGAAVVAAGFVIVALVKQYGSAHPSFFASAQAVQWSSEAGAVGVAAVAFGLAGSPVRATGVKLGFGAAALGAVGSAGYAFSLKGSYGTAELWYLVAATAAFLGASAAARMQTARSPRT
jgi:hypothetical protein